jgi:hypothetical protein
MKINNFFGGSQWGSNPPAAQVPHIGFEVRARHRPGIASLEIVAREGAVDWMRTGAKVAPRPVIPRSSNGRTAAFGAVNRGSNPCRGARFRFSVRPLSD